MGTAVRAQVATVLGLALLAACQDPAGDSDPGHPPARQTGETRNRPAALEGTPAEVVAGLVRRCHGMLAGQDQMGVAFLNVARPEAPTQPEQVVLWTEGRMRRRHPTGAVDVRLPEGAWRATPGGESLVLTTEEIAELDTLQGLLRAALLEPLYAAETVRHQGGHVYQLIQPGGATWRLELGKYKPPDSDPLLLPRSLSGPHGTLVWVEYLHTGVTHLPRRMALGALGERIVSLEQAGFAIDDGWFTDPLDPQRKPTETTTHRTDDDVPVVGRPKIGRPWVGRTGPSRSLVSVDPGTWDARRTLAVVKNGKELRNQGQECADLDFLFDDGGRRLYAQPFEMHRERGRPFVARPHQRILRLPPQRVVFVRTRAKSLAAAETAGRAALQKFLKRRNLQPDGPLRIRPFVQIDQPDGVPETLEVQFEQPVRD